MHYKAIKLALDSFAAQDNTTGAIRFLLAATDGSMRDCRKAVGSHFAYFWTQRDANAKESLATTDLFTLLDNNHE